VLRESVDRGEDWYESLLHVIGRWTDASEEIDGVEYHYLIAGEAFDWLLLAQRLLEEVEDLVPQDQTEQLLLFGLAPLDADEEDFEQAIGARKYAAHLNFQYGVIIEELLLVAAELEIQKAGRLSGAGKPPPEVTVFEHVYGKSLEELQILYKTSTERLFSEEMSQYEWQLFTYWCSKYRVRNVEPARVASDTRKAMALMSRMERGRYRLAGRRPDRYVRLRVGALRR
jgi:hypothetical protein